MSSPKIVPTEEFKHVFTHESPLVIDVRPTREFESFHLEGVLNIPPSELSSPPLKAMLEAAKLEGKAVYILCHSGKRAAAAAKKMASDNDGNCFVVRGGTVACDDFGMKIIRGNNQVSTMRRPWILSGFLIILSVVLGFTVQERFYLVAGLLGTGLIVRGMTGTGPND